MNLNPSDSASASSNVELAPGVWLPRRALQFIYARSSGPGGQHVNKTATRARLRVALADLAPIIGEAALKRLVRLAGARVTKEGVLQLVSAENRSQIANRRRCIDRLSALIEQAMRPPRIRRQTRLRPSDKQQRLDDKRHRSRAKRRRQRPPDAD